MKGWGQDGEVFGRGRSAAVWEQRAHGIDLFMGRARWDFIENFVSMEDFYVAMQFFWLPRSFCGSMEIYGFYAISFLFLCNIFMLLCNFFFVSMQFFTFLCI